MRALPSGVLVALLLAGCAAAPPLSDDPYTVHEQDTLYSIAWRHGLDYRDVARWNGLGSDYRIVVGQRLNLHPVDGVTARPPTAPTAPTAPPRPAGAPPPPSPAPLPAGERVTWVWPTARTGHPQSARSGGLLFPGQRGQPVRAAARGRVVYTGSGIRGYGQLIIIKHSPTLLSAYAYNDQVLVHDGDEVAAGQPIAAMGLGPHQVPVLYFEIRVEGRPSNPLPYLEGLK